MTYLADCYRCLRPNPCAYWRWLAAHHFRVSIDEEYPAYFAAQPGSGVAHWTAQLQLRDWYHDWLYQRGQLEEELPGSLWSCSVSILASEKALVNLKLHGIQGRHCLPPDYRHSDLLDPSISSPDWYLRRKTSILPSSHFSINLTFWTHMTNHSSIILPDFSFKHHQLKNIHAMHFHQYFCSLLFWPGFSSDFLLFDVDCSSDSCSNPLMLSSFDFLDEFHPCP